MARSYGQIMSAIWNDPGFRALTGEQQRVYLMLVTQAEISSAGTIALTLKRWAGYASDSTSDALSDALSELQSKRFIAYDEDTEELVVRSFVKWDGGATNEKRRPAITSAANAAVSPKIREVLRLELDKLGVPHALGDSPSDSHPDTPRVVVTEVSTSHNPESLNREPVAMAHPAPKSKRSTRVPEEFRPTDDQRSWATEGGVTDIDAETAQWRDHHKAKGTTALDWDASWRTWMRNSVKFSRAPTVNGKSRAQQETDDIFAGASERMGVTA